MSHHPATETEFSPEHSETPRLPSQRKPEHYTVTERVVVFAPMGYNQRNLKRGTIEHVDERTKRARVRLDHPPRIPSYHGTQLRPERGTYSVAVNQPILMKESDYDRLRGDRAAAREWVSDGYMDSQRLRDALCQKLVVIGVNEAEDSAPPDAQIQ